MLTQYEITHMENLMVRDEYWNDGNYWDDEDDDVVTYCDIYDCEDCPRYGDDCDGDFDEEE